MKCHTDCLNKSFATTERKQLEAPVQMNFATLAFTKEAWKCIALNLVSLHLNARTKFKNKTLG